MPLVFRGALLNSASPWSSTKEQLAELYDCPHTGAVTIRTSLLEGWKHDDSINQWKFFDARSNSAVPERSPNANSSINTYGYSPTPLGEYLSIIDSIVSESRSKVSKPFIISVSGSPQDIIKCRRKVAEHALKTSIPLLLEINLSCPNLPDNSPPAYSSSALQEYLFALQRAETLGMSIPVGIKTPPFTCHDQFKTIINALEQTTGGDIPCPVDFITATNTLGNCLVMTESEGTFDQVAAINSSSGTGVGGLGGTAIHALSLGNVKTLRMMLDQCESLRHIEIIGVGGVSDYLGYQRMRSVGAAAVAIGTNFGKAGIDIFHKIASELRTMERTTIRASR